MRSYKHKDCIIEIDGTDMQGRTLSIRYEDEDHHFCIWYCGHAKHEAQKLFDLATKYIDMGCPIWIPNNVKTVPALKQKKFLEAIEGIEFKQAMIEV